jgi:hypothetical protein
MAHEGPFHGTLFTYKAIGNAAPSELRLASLAERFTDGKVNASLYRLVADEKEAGGFHLASYQHLRDMESGIGLIDMWLMPQGEEE